MEIRAGIEADIPEIVQLLKTSLGESLMPKSERYWRWKHLENPFGPSPVLLAVEHDKIIGVRAFMRWTWSRGNEKMQAVRAVDTATHPEYQGRGIFSKLTIQALTKCKEQGIDLVFNTPNSKSMPGYIKMGWEEAGRLPINIKAMRPFHLLSNLITGTSNSERMDDMSLEKYLNHPGLETLLVKHQRSNNSRWLTCHSRRSLQWRYAQVPVAHYFAAALERSNALSALIIFRLKVSRLGREMRITDVFMETDDSGEVKRIVKEKAKEFNADLVTTGSFIKPNLIDGALSVANRNLGPIVTIKEINTFPKHDFMNFLHWNPSVGDLELF